MLLQRNIVDKYPDTLARSSYYRLKVNGDETDVLHNVVADFATFAADGVVTISIVVLGELPVCSADVVVRPLSRDIIHQMNGRVITFALDDARNCVVEVAGRPALYLMISKPDENEYKMSSAPGVHFFAAGQVYDIGQLKIDSGETVYIQGGAVVRGSIYAADAEDLRISGRGILDDGYFSSNGVGERRPLVLERCRDVTIDGITIINPIAWMVVLSQCTDVLIKNLHELGEVGSSDGIDVVSSRRVRIEDCIIENGDDCVVIKALAQTDSFKPTLFTDVEDVVVERCIFGNNRGGNAMEIGFELPTAVVRNITFRDCDVLHVHTFGAAMSIHNSDRAAVHDVLFEDIRVEHHFDKLIDVRVVTSRYGVDTQRGSIRNVTFRNIYIAQSKFNPGYTCSTIGGFDQEHPVENVLFENIIVNGIRIKSLDEIDLFTRHLNGIALR